MRFTKTYKDIRKCIDYYINEDIIVNNKTKKEYNIDITLYKKKNYQYKYNNMFKDNYYKEIAKE